MAGIAKGNTGELPFVVANELICARLASAILLPVPPGFIIDKDGSPHYASLNFNLAGEDLPPANVESLVLRDPALAMGITIFDIWIVNDDRHRNNLDYDADSGKVQIFDHSHAFFHGGNPRQRLVENEQSLGIGSHSVASRLRSLEGLSTWVQRINEIPEFYISEVVSSASELGLPPNDVEFCTKYLLDRRLRIQDLILANQEAFPSINPQLWNGIESGGSI